jgi:hypothetical protein
MEQQDRFFHSDPERIELLLMQCSQLQPVVLTVFPLRHFTQPRITICGKKS